MILKTDRFIVYFGDKMSCNVDYKTPNFMDFCTDFAARNSLKKILFNKQVHGNRGFLIDNQATLNNFKNVVLEGDFLVTDQNNVGIGVLTADCLPVLFYDAKNHFAAAIHAGWKSAVADICKEAFQMMNKNYGTNAADLSVFFGPCAKACCYEVTEDFLPNLEQFSFKNRVIKKAGKQLFFDNPLFNKLLISELGVTEERINYEYNLCTICNSNFYSYRREMQTSLRQISFIALL